MCSRIIYSYLNAIVPFAAVIGAEVSLLSVSAVTEAAGDVPVVITVVLTISTSATLESDLVVTLAPADGALAGMLKYTEFRQCTTCYIPLSELCTCNCSILLLFFSFGR